MDDDLESLDAYLVSLEEGTDAALRRLSDRSDPDSVRRRIAILLDASREEEACILAKSFGFNERVCEVGIQALVRARDRAKATELLSWARSHTPRTTAARSALIFAAESLHTVIVDHAPGEILPGELSGDEDTVVREALSAVEQVVVGVNRLENELERKGVETALRASVLLDDRTASERFAQLLATSTPISPLLAELAIADRIPPPVSLSARLRNEDGSFQAHLLAAVADSRLLGNHQHAFAAARELTSRPLSAEEREVLARTLIDIGRSAGQEAEREADRLAAELSQGGRLARLREAERLLRSARLAEAAQIVDDTRDEADALWLQLAANLHLQRREEATAIALLQKATSLLPAPDLLLMTANIAYHYDSPRAAIEPMRRLTLARPRDLISRRRLAALLLETGDVEAAVTEYRDIVDRGLDEDTDRMNYASLLVRRGDLQGALDILSPIVNRAEPAVEAVIAQSDVLMLAGRTDEAFEALWSRQHAFWDDPGFVLRVLQRGFRSGHETEGHQAMLRLQQLQSEGRAEEKLLQEVPLDAVVETLKQRHTTVEDLLKKVIAGQAPWLLPDLAFGNAAYSAWAVRTQPLRWFFDDPVARAQHAIYATNAFAIRGIGAGPQAARLEELDCPAARTPVVADLTALITLHRLGLLEQSAEFFGTVYVPSAYMPNVVADAERLLPQQPSRHDAAVLVKKAIDEGRIAITDEAPSASLIEYDSSSRRGVDYAIRDAIEVLHDNGRLADAEHIEALKVAHRIADAIDARPSLALGQPIRSDVSTLETIAQAGILSNLVDAFPTSVTRASHEELVGILRGFETQRTLWSWNDDLWKSIRTNPHFHQRTPTLPTDWKELGDHPGFFVPLASVALARETNAPLLADDRVCQMMLLNERAAEPHASFGSDRLIVALHDAGAIDVAAASDAFLTLARWRYRFCLFPAAVLKALADRYRQHPPGKDLRSVALYVHDCMSDAGLFRGKEATDPPVSMASMFFVRWTGTIGEFLMDVWLDAGWEEEQAAALTRWACAALLPSAPIAPSVTETASSPHLSSKIVLTRALLRAAQATDSERANRALRSISEELGRTEGEFLDVVAEVINGLSHTR